MFGVLYANKPLKKRGSIDILHQSSREKGEGEESDPEADQNRPSVEWLPSSGEELENEDAVDELQSIRD